jgi:hypothetical protein
MFREATQYPMQTQAKIIFAIAVLRNFIRRHDRDDFEEVRQVDGEQMG